MDKRYYQGSIVEPDCNRCPLRGCRKVLPDGMLPSKLCFVGENPGAQEEREGRGFVGPSGKLLWYLAGAVGISREDCWVSNASLCRPRDVRFSTGATLNKEAVVKMSAECCKRRLIGELLTVTQGDPKAVIVPLGNVSMKSLMPYRKNMRVMSYRGSIMPLDLQVLWNEVNLGRG